MKKIIIVLAFIIGAVSSKAQTQPQMGVNSVLFPGAGILNRSSSNYGTVLNGWLVGDTLTTAFNNFIWGWGDSYTAGTGASQTSLDYFSLLCLFTGTLPENKGQGGTRLTSKGTPSDSSMEDRLYTVLPYASNIYMTTLIYGTNDAHQSITVAQYRAAWVEVLDTFIARGYTGHLAIGGPGYAPADADSLISYQMDTCAQNVAAQFGIPFIDVFHAMISGLPNINFPDGVHPNNRGHLLISLAANDAIQPYNPQQSASLNVYGPANVAGVITGQSLLNVDSINMGTHALRNECAVCIFDQGTIDHQMGFGLNTTNHIMGVFSGGGYTLAFGANKNWNSLTNQNAAMFVDNTVSTNKLHINLLADSLTWGNSLLWSNRILFFDGGTSTNRMGLGFDSIPKMMGIYSPTGYGIMLGHAQDIRSLTWATADFRDDSAGKIHIKTLADSLSYANDLVTGNRYLLFQGNDTAHMGGIGLNSSDAAIIFSAPSGYGFMWGSKQDANSMAWGNAAMRLDSSGLLHIKNLGDSATFTNQLRPHNTYLSFDGGANNTRDGEGLDTTGHGFDLFAGAGYHLRFGQQHDVWTMTDANSTFYVDSANIYTNSPLIPTTDSSLTIRLGLPTERYQLIYSALPIYASGPYSMVLENVTNHRFEKIPITSLPFAPTAGSTSITTLGTITTGVWNGTPVTPAFGGTGLATYTPYAVITGGTTATGTLQQVSGLGSSGQALVSNGASALPTWQTIAGSGGGVFRLSPLDSNTAGATSSGAQINGVSLGLQSASVTNAGLINTGAQTLAGNKSIGSGSTWAFQNITSQRIIMGKFQPLDITNAQGNSNDTAAGRRSTNQWAYGSTSTTQAAILVDSSDTYLTNIPGSTSSGMQLLARDSTKLGGPIVVYHGAPFAPATGSANYIQASPGSAQSAFISITGSVAATALTITTGASAFTGGTGIATNGILIFANNTGVQENNFQGTLKTLIGIGTTNFVALGYGGTTLDSVGDLSTAGSISGVGVTSGTGALVSGGVTAFGNWNNITTGTSSTVPAGFSNTLFNPASLITTYTLTLPASPVDGQIENIYFGGTIAGNSAVVTSLTISPNSGQTIEQSSVPTTGLGGTVYKYKYNFALSKWFRDQ